MADRRGILVPLIILGFIFLSPDPVRAPHQSITGRTIDHVIAEEQHALAEVQNSTFTEHALPNLNITGFEPERGYAWDTLPLIKQKARGQSEYALGEWSSQALELDATHENAVPLYKNVTGFVHGKWVRSKLAEDLSAPNLNLSEYAPVSPFGNVVGRPFGRNVSGEEGDVRIRFHERQHSAFATLDADVLGNVTNIDVELTISDDHTEYELRLLGVYFPPAGEAVLTTTSDKFAGIFALPHLALSSRMFDVSRTLLNASISRVIQRQIDRDTERFNPWTSTLDGVSDSPFPPPECEVILYLQQLPPSNPTAPSFTSSPLTFLENELRFPTGAFLPSAPPLHFSFTLFSPDCGYVLESKGPPSYSPAEDDHLRGPKVEALYHASRHHLLLFTLTLAAQLALLMRQMREASTPSTRSRISLYTIAMLALGDGFIFMALLLISFFVGGLWVTLMGTAFLAFVSVSFFGMRFLMDLWAVQAPEREARWRVLVEEERGREERFQEAVRRLRERREVAAAAAATIGEAGTNEVQEANATDVPPVSDGNAPITTGNTTTTNVTPQPPPEQPPPGSLPLPVTAQRPTDTGATPVPFFMPSDQEGLEPIDTTPTNQLTTTNNPPMPRESFGSLYTRFYLLLLGTLFVSLNATSWPPTLRRLYFTALGLIYTSYWIPQINRNVQRNCRKALNWEFVVGQSLLRLVPFAYVYGYEGNVLFAEVDYTSLGALGVWTWLQVLVLGSQSVVGARWFVRRKWVPEAYDYHPVLREDEEGGTMPIGFTQSSTSEPTSPVAGRERAPSSLSDPRSRRGSVAAKETKEKGKRVFDCAICMQELEVSVIESGAGSSGENLTGPAGLLARRMYMVTPCRHIFHSGCLEGWMKYRLQCPVCRESLPPL